VCTGSGRVPKDFLDNAEDVQGQIPAGSGSQIVIRLKTDSTGTVEAVRDLKDVPGSGLPVWPPIRLSVPESSR
jgi:hypothetical protein